MAVLAQYDPPPEAQYGRSANLFFSGMNQAQSLMERKQAMALNQQRTDQQRMEFIAKLPAIVAEAQYKQAQAAVAVKNATDQINFSRQATLDTPVAQQEFLDAMKYNVANEDSYVGGASDGTPEGDAAQAAQAKADTQATLDARSQKLAAIAAKYSYMAVVPEYKGFIDRVNSEAANAHLQAASNLRLEELMNAAQYRADASRYGADTRLQGQVYGADARTTQVGMRDTTGLQREGIRAANRLDVVAAQGENQVQKDARSIQYLSEQAVQSEQDAAAAQASDPALAEILRGNAARLRDAATKRSTFAGGTPSAPSAPGAAIPHRPAPVDTSPPAAVSISIPGSDVTPSDAGTPATVATPVAPTKVDPKATSIDIGGKTYPIYKDKNGKRAYKVDGHFVPLDTQ
jgi:hypothetical protein